MATITKKSDSEKLKLEISWRCVMIVQALAIKLLRKQWKEQNGECVSEGRQKSPATFAVLHKDGISTMIMPKSILEFMCSPLSKMLVYG